MFVIFKTGTLWFFDSPPCESGAIINSLLLASRGQLACLQLFNQCLRNTAGFATLVFIEYLPV
jgi:hypothetical protein